MNHPRKHQTLDADQAPQPIETHPLGTWVCHTSEGMEINHVPFWLDRTQGPHGTLIGPIARDNGVWRRCPRRPHRPVVARGGEH